MAKVCCKKKGASGPNCIAQPGTEFTFLVTVGQGEHFSGETAYGYSNGTSGLSTGSFGSITEVDYSAVSPEYRGVDDFFQQEGGSSDFKSKEDQNGVSYDLNGDVYIDGVIKTKPFFTAADIGKTFCVSLNAEKIA